MGSGDGDLALWKYLQNVLKLLANVNLLTIQQNDKC